MNYIIYDTDYDNFDTLPGHRLDDVCKTPADKKNENKTYRELLNGDRSSNASNYDSYLLAVYEAYMFFRGNDGREVWGHKVFFDINMKCFKISLKDIDSIPKLSNQMFNFRLDNDSEFREDQSVWNEVVDTNIILNLCSVIKHHSNVINERNILDEVSAKLDKINKSEKKAVKKARRL